MKFIHYKLLRENLVEETSSKDDNKSKILEHLSKYQDWSEAIDENLDNMYFKIITEEIQEIDKILNESIAMTWAFISDPIKAKKIFNSYKKLVQVKIQKAALDIDFEKKKEALRKAGLSKEEKSDKSEILNKAQNLKKQSLNDLEKAITQRMSDLSSKDKKLAELVSYLKNKADLIASQKLFKAASGEEAKELGLKIENIQQVLSKKEDQFRDYDEEAKNSAEYKKAQEEKDKVMKDLEKSENKENKDSKDAKNQGTEKKEDTQDS